MAGEDAVATGIRAVGDCGPLTAVARAGFPSSDISDSFSSESRGATRRSASTSFSNRVSSISFWRNTSYTFFILAPGGVVSSTMLL